MWRLVAWCVVGAACKGDKPSAPSPHAPGRIEIVSPALPALVAVRSDGSNEWRILASTGDAYVLPDLGSRFTIVTVCPMEYGSDVEVRHWTSEDPLDLVIGCIGFDGEALVKMKPRFAAGDVTQGVSTGGIHESCVSDREDCYLRTGTRDAIVRYEPSKETTRARLIRGFRGIESASFDADASAGWQPDRRTIEVVGGEGDYNGSAYVCFETHRGSKVMCSGQTYWGAFPDRIEQTYLRVPTSERLATDCDLLEVSNVRMCLSDVPRTRVVISHRELPTLDYDRAAATLRGSFDADALEITVRGGSRTPTWNIIATRRWLHGANAFVLPDLAAIPGWKPEWSRPPRETIDAALIFGPKPSAQWWASSKRLWQPMTEGDRVEHFNLSVRNAELER